MIKEMNKDRGYFNFYYLLFKSIFIFFGKL